ncbi:TIGR01244 family phosphatase [Pseudaminobacter arsenicus]|uniref:TVP38/TMEM64 family membrane protein n=1 Tax=Borborobacter arsenicus TaxID=1851146 RepID=A0A432V8S8_9HYPH|nr:TIGR01244 family sulfur transferase [Pseudaminobacter arsenicus]RUM98483.1 TIGR01244 family phosphatase [Pseudaminobacter arsenicus]
MSVEIRELDPAFWVSAQLGAADMAELAKAGVTTVVNNRPDGEAQGQPTDEELRAAAETAGLAYVSIAFRGMNAKPAQVRALAEVISGSRGPVLGFCQSGFRSAMLWAAAGVRRGRSFEDVSARAAAAGYDLSKKRGTVEALAAALGPSGAPKGKMATFGYWPQIAFLLTLLAAYLFITPVRIEIDRLVFLFAMADVSALRGFVESMGPWAPLTSIALFIFQAVIAPLPAFLVTFANAALFGWVYGALLSWSGATLGAIACYGLARWLGHSLIERFVPGASLARFEAHTDRYGAWAVFIARLLPFVSFDFVSYAAGLVRVPFWRFLLATGIGQMPATIVYSLAGDFAAVNLGLLAGGIAFTFVVAAFIAASAGFARRRKPEQA